MVGKIFLFFLLFLAIKLRVRSAGIALDKSPLPKEKDIRKFASCLTIRFFAPINPQWEILFRYAARKRQFGFLEWFNTGF